MTQKSPFCQKKKKKYCVLHKIADSSRKKKKNIFSERAFFTACSINITAREKMVTQKYYECTSELSCNMGAWAHVNFFIPFSVFNSQIISRFSSVDETLNSLWHVHSLMRIKLLEKKTRKKKKYKLWRTKRRHVTIKRIVLFVCCLLVKCTSVCVCGWC